jgi:phytoene/squalene synthetase
MVHKPTSSQEMAASITRKASKQTYYTIRVCVDRDLVNEAFLAYAYFRWVDDMLDTQIRNKTDMLAFIDRQKDLLAASYREECVGKVCPEERMLVELVRSDRGDHPGLLSYLKNMMAVMEFDAVRRGQLISQLDLALYSQGLAIAVTDAMHYFIGHDDPAPADETRYSAVYAAHVTHMLRDTQDDIKMGYFNIPHEYLSHHDIEPSEINHPAYTAWICRRVNEARRDFQEGHDSLAKISNFRCRLVGFAYTARFEWMLRTIERENYCLRSGYPERKGLAANLWILWNTFSSALVSPWTRSRSPDPSVQSVSLKEL